MAASLQASALAVLLCVVAFCLHLSQPDICFTAAGLSERATDWKASLSQSHGALWVL